MLKILKAFSQHRIEIAYSTIAFSGSALLLFQYQSTQNFAWFIALSFFCTKMAIGMINQKTTAVRIIPVIGKEVGEMVEFGGLLGYAPVMPVNQFGCERLINRLGRIPAPIHSFKN